MFHYDKELAQYALDNQALIEADYKKMLDLVSKSNAVYKGKPLPFLYYPSIYNEKDVENFQQLTQDIFKVINESVEVFMNHPEVRWVWGFDKDLEDLIILDQAFEANVPMGRFDFFYYPDGSYQFCELNTDGTSAMNEETPLTDILLGSQGMEAFKKDHQIKRYELYESWVHEVSSIYDEFVQAGHPRTQEPYVVIMDFMSTGSPHEFKVFKDTFNRMGYRAAIVSPDHLAYDQGHLYHEGEKVDIIYRRLVTRDMMNSKEKLGDLLEGIRAGKTCVIGSIRSQIVHTKKYFEALHHDQVRQYLSQKTKDYIDAHIPYTASLKRDKHYDHYLSHKDDYIIKPIDYYASKGVYAGFEQSQEDWVKMVDEGIESGYVIQKFCKKSKNMNLYFDEDMKMHVAEVNNITGVFVYNQKMKGIFTRAGFNGVISDLNDGYSLSSIVAWNK